MFFFRLTFICLILLYSQIVLAQKANPFQTTKNFLAYKFTAGYPFFSHVHTDNYHYLISRKSINYGIGAGFEMGHSFNKKFSLSISPTLLYSKFSQFDYRYTVYKYDLLASELNASANQSTFSALVPLNANFLVKDKIHFSLGFFILNPFTSKTYSKGIWTDYSYYPPKMLTDIDDYKNYDTDARGGFHFQIAYNYKARNWVQKWVSLEFFHSLTTNRYSARENWLMVSFKKLFFQ